MIFQRRNAYIAARRHCRYIRRGLMLLPRAIDFRDVLPPLRAVIDAASYAC